MAAESRQVHLGDVLAIVAEHPYISPTGVDGAVDLIEFMYGQRPQSSAEAGRAAMFVRDTLIAQHPQLSGIDSTSTTEATYKEWLREQIAKYSENLTVTPIANLEECGLCKGSGIDPRLLFEPCIRCNGLKRVPSEYNPESSQGSNVLSVQN